MGHAVDLLAQGFIESGVPMTVKIAPDAADSIQQFATIEVNQRATARLLDNQRRVVSHLREGMPDNLAVPLF